MRVRPDLDRPIAGVFDPDPDGYAIGVQIDVAVLNAVLAGDQGCPQRIGSCTVTSLVPSGNVPSTWISWIISGTPSITSCRARMFAPNDINSETDRPSRIPSSTSAVISATASG